MACPSYQARNSNSRAQPRHRSNHDALALFLALLYPSGDLLRVHALRLPELSRLLAFDLALDELECREVIADRLALPAERRAEVRPKGDDSRSHDVIGDDLSVMGPEKEEENPRKQRRVPFL
jgi:hypothetical protein